MSDAILERAHAKLNVFLRVLRRRDDGYHDIETVLLPVDLADEVTVEPAPVFEVRIEGPRADELTSLGGDTLLRRAAEAFAEARPDAPSARVRLMKRIPLAAGMGGGSADAAALLRALGRIHGVERHALAEIATRVGSDVPGLLEPGAVHASGRGERLASVTAQTTTWVVRPFPFAVAAADAYRWWDEVGSTGPDPGALIAALETGNDELLGSAIYDDLQDAVVARHPEVAEAIEAFTEAGALGAIVTGSGPTVVALARHLAHADALARELPGSFVVTGPPRTMGTRTMGGDRSGVV